MDAESQIEAQDQTEKKTSLPYLFYVFGIGLASIALMIYWGYVGYSFLISVAIGGAIQVLFRTTKIMWSNSLNPQYNKTHNTKNIIVQGIVETLPTVKVFTFLYGAMILVSSLWYGIGRLFGWFLS